VGGGGGGRGGLWEWDNGWELVGGLGGGGGEGWSIRRG